MQLMLSKRTKIFENGQNLSQRFQKTFKMEIVMFNKDYLMKLLGVMS